MKAEIFYHKEMAEVLLLALLVCCTWKGHHALARPESCQFAGNEYQVGEKWHPKLHPVQAEECVNCTCLKGGEVQCVAADCPKPDCDDPKYVHGKCCPVCEVVEPLPGSEITEPPGCTFFDTQYEDGARFPSNRTSYTPKYDDQCVLCDCFRGKVSCHVKTCKTYPNCIKTTREPDDCCPVCKEFVPDWNGNISESLDGDESELRYGDCLTPAGRKENGTKWKPEVENYGIMECVVCQCKNGHVSCSRIMCPAESALKCKRPQRRRGACCRECYAGKRRKGRKNGKKRGERKGDKKGGRKAKGQGKSCNNKKSEDVKERKKKGRKKRCKSHGKNSLGSKRKGKSRKRKGATTKRVKVIDEPIPADAIVSDVKDTLCLPKRVDKLVYLIKTDDMYSLALDDVEDNSIERILWVMKKGRIEATERKRLLDPVSYRGQVKAENIVGATTKRHVKKFMKKLERKQKKCKKKCRRKMLDRLFKKLKTKKVDLTKRCRA